MVSIIIFPLIFLIFCFCVDCLIYHVTGRDVMWWAKYSKDIKKYKILVIGETFIEKQKEKTSFK